MIGDAERQMIDAAERLAAEEGLGAMSLRAVQTAAGQRNKSAAQYHFGSREGLIEAVIIERMRPINQRRADLLADLGETATVSELVDTLARPLVEAVLRPEESYWARFVMAAFTDPTVADVVRRSLEGQAYRTAHDQLLERLDHLPAERRRRRLDSAVALLFVSLAVVERRAADEAAGPTGSAPLEAVIHELVTVCTAVLEAPA
ncbi:MAG: TetR family transcriptional regulator [Acidimicrobiales bacterium]